MLASLVRHDGCSVATSEAVYPDLCTRRVFITGGGSGIGAALVEAFVRQGAHVAFVDIDADVSQALVDRIRDLGSAPWWRRCDVTDVHSLQQAITDAAQALGALDVLVNNVGSDDRHIRINVLSPGWVMTERQRVLWLTAESEKELMENQCLPDKIMPADIASMALFLASDASRACTAQEFVVDAGWT